MTLRVAISIIAAGALPLNASAHAAVTQYTNKVAWQNAAGNWTTLPFTDLPDGTLITNQYAAQGVVFTDGSDFIYHSTSFLNDGAGVNGAFDTIWLSFNQPMFTIGADYPGSLKISLYSDGQLIYASSDFDVIVSHFAGLISTEPFDTALIIDPAGGVFIDDLHFGPPIPVPGVLALLTTTAMVARVRRRRE